MKEEILLASPSRKSRKHGHVVAVLVRVVVEACGGLEMGVAPTEGKKREREGERLIRYHGVDRGVVGVVRWTCWAGGAERRCAG